MNENVKNMNGDKVLELVDRFREKRVLVIGDLMVDKYVVGNVERVSPEAPVPVLDIRKEKLSLGGAGNSVKNLISLGAKVSVMGAVGQDDAGQWIINEMQNIGADTSFILVHPERPTTQKIRFVNENYHQLMRADIEKREVIPHNLLSPILDRIKMNIKEFDAVIISDYAKGVIGDYIVQIIDAAKNLDKPVIVDGKPVNKNLFKGCTLITPNKKEASEIAGIEIKDDDSLIKAGIQIANELKCHVLITRGSEGMSLFSDGNVEHIPSCAGGHEVIDVCGAGDTVSAVVTLAISSGASLKESANIANLAAGLVVNKKGVVAVDPDEFRKGLFGDINCLVKEGIEVNRNLVAKELVNIKKFSDLLVQTYRNGNKVLIFGNGGSASDAQHLAGELVGRFKYERKGLPAIALNAETATLTAIANDYGYENVFGRQVEALAQKGDLVVGITTSGNSANVVDALHKAKKAGAVTVGLTGESGGKIRDIVDLCIRVPSNNTPRIQEAHGVIIHIVCELLDNQIDKLKK